MTEAPLDAHLARERRHAALSFALDDALGTHHGISWADFVLLQALHEAGGAVPDGDLARQLGLPGSRLLLRVRPLEKVGLVQRAPHASQRRESMLSAGGRRVLREARETAAALCASRGAQGDRRRALAAVSDAPEPALLI